MEEIKVKLIDKNAKIPKKANDDDAGFDIFSIERKKILPGESAIIKTGISIELPKGTEAQIRPRSGLALKNQITVLNTPGTIDSGYRGEVGVILINHNKKEAFDVKVGMRIAQMVINKVYPVEIKVADILTASERGEGGFGSTGL